MRGSQRRGVTMIELIWVSCVLVLIVALQLPAIVRAREAARRSQCVNNLKQFTLALHSYHASNGSVPMSEVYGRGHGTGQGAYTQLLPYMENTAVYNAYNFDLENWHVANRTAVGVKLSSFLCPSNRAVEMRDAASIVRRDGTPYTGTSVFAPLHYGVNWGGARPASGEAASRAYPGKNLGLIIPVADPGALPPTRNVSFRDVTDGLSNTLASAEKRDGFGWAVGGWGGTEFDVNLSPAYEGDDPKARRAFSGSYHDGGVNASMGDGSVRFFKTETNPVVWRALSTRAGGEKIAAE